MLEGNAIACSKPLH